MSETFQHENERPALGGGFDRQFGGTPDAHQTITVSSGPHIEEIPVAETTVGEIRRRFGSRFDIDPQSQAILDGHTVDNQTIVRAGQALMFAREAGEKGGRDELF